MKKLLLTGFEPFLDFTINPTEQIVKALDGEKIGPFQIVGKKLPVDFSSSGSILLKEYYEVMPDIIISLGLAAGRTTITPERIAINCKDGEKDNRGIIKKDEKIVENGPDGLFTTLPIREIVDGLNEMNIPAEISNSAGTYLCNLVMYEMLHHLKIHNTSLPSGFIHIPASHEMAIHKRNMPSWSQSDLENAIRNVIKIIGKNE
ncbi:pyroglutamyl-peptidase I [Bacillus sp. RG28]|uniref:Pyroglutamyl-peptidase I n=1 Tax=Gottfriedia endophytica TaxID=2820819 RepID=A0A940NMF7_9BACI|nr:pyroglutamyl-peptidase I [Gottfriedia endophytica]MBP0726987.1 pyroglutamyl-peptidase I [Gottfriedia endophytica]